MEKKVTVLMAEDNQHDIVATKRAWKHHNIANPLYIVNDGEECIDYLLQRGKYEDSASAPRPDVILLDINMPKMNGLDVLEFIRKEESLKHLPVIIN